MSRLRTANMLVAFVLLSCLALNVSATSQTFSVSQNVNLIVQSNIAGSIVSAGLDETLAPNQVMIYVIGASTYEIVQKQDGNTLKFTVSDTNPTSAGTSLSVPWVLLLASLCHWFFARNTSAAMLIVVCF